MSALYQLAAEYRADAEKLADMDMDEQTMLDTLEGMGGELESKAINVAMVVRNTEAEVAAIKDAMKQMKERCEAKERKAERIRKYLLDNMQVAGVLKIECPYFKLAVRDNPPAVEVFDQAQVPDSLLRKSVAAVITDDMEVTHDERRGGWITITGPRDAFKFAEDPDKTAIKEAIKAGQEVTGCRLTTGKRLEVK